jgi:hypothetical protein
MVRRDQRWPIWKIALAVAGCGSACALLLWLSTVAAPPETESAEAQETAMLTVPIFLQMTGTAVGMLTILGVIWLVSRIRESRIPVWERKKPRKRRKRRFR